MPPFIRDNTPLVWTTDQDQNQDQNEDQDQVQDQNEDQDQDQNHDQDQNPNPNEEPIVKDDESNELFELYMVVLLVRTTVDQNRADAERAGLNMASRHQRYVAYSNLLIEFEDAVCIKLALNRQGHTAETAMDHRAVSQQIHRLYREVSEFYDRYIIE